MGSNCSTFAHEQLAGTPFYYAKLILDVVLILSIVLQDMITFYYVNRSI